MRINQFVAQATGVSRRVADKIVSQHHIQVNNVAASAGLQIEPVEDVVTLDGKVLSLPSKTTTIILNKPAGYVCSRDGQGSRTIYELLPTQYHQLKPVGRLDKDSSGLLLLTNDGQLAHHLTHPSFEKKKIYEVALARPLLAHDKQRIENGIRLNDGPSHLLLKGRDQKWVVTMSEGRNRQIRRTFAELGYKVITLHRTNFGQYKLGNLQPGKYRNSN